jgi:UPF0042 nucleotide-binding protein
VNNSPDAVTFLTKTTDLLEFVLPRYEREGKSYLTVGIGCTGGRHRSIALTEALAAALSVKSDLRIEVVHRDIDRDAASSGTGESFIGGATKGGSGS